MSNATKSPGRTPPFVLVALLLIVFILSYNYWKLSSSIKTLREENNRHTIQSKDLTEKRLHSEKALESAREELRVLQGNLDQVKKTLKDREDELKNVKAEQKKAADETKKCKDSLAKCDSDLKTEKTNEQKIKGENTKLTKELEEAKKQAVCDVTKCLKPVQDVVGLFTKLVGTEAIVKSLTDGGLDAKKIMEGLPTALI